MANKFEEEEVSGDCTPIDLKNIDWTSRDYRRIVAARLVKGVYQHEEDRQDKKKDAKYESKAPFWWKSVHFRHVRDIIDASIPCHSIFGCIFKYKAPKNTSKPQDIPSPHRPPKYVIAFRGTVLKKRTIVRDLIMDALLLFNLKTKYKNSLDPVHDIIDEVGSENVWLAGHSLGAAIALQVGKTMARETHYIETYLFNPPFCSLPVEMVPSRKLKTGYRMARNVVTAGALAMKSAIHRNQQSNDEFSKFCQWIPYLFVNENDPISCEYIGYFEHREKMESRGTDRIQRYIARNSLISVGSCLYGGDVEALHQIPSTLLFKNRIAWKLTSLEPHHLSQWLDPNLVLRPKLYQFNLKNEENKAQD